jgi:CDP-glucose 4,6-dehydratase
MNAKPPSFFCELQEAFAGKRVFITGHTGFKGSWLSEWLLSLGAELRGYALAPETEPSLFILLGLAGRMDSREGDLRDAAALEAALLDFAPDVVFHLAAQPLVVASYKDPRATFEVNVMGTAHLLEALRKLSRPCTAILVSSDKCYRNDNTGKPFTEEDPLGGHDPYSASKGAMEILVHAYRHSFFRDAPVTIATARAGNVIGGGDYAADRIVPDCYRALAAGQPVPVRNPGHTRPWQHVLEPLSGYLLLAARMAAGWTDPEGLHAFNFGPDGGGNQTVETLVDTILGEWPGTWHTPQKTPVAPESVLLSLSAERAARLLGWKPQWGFEETVRQTMAWYRKAHELAPDDKAAFIALVKNDLETYTMTERDA